ncbi:SET and MYND domain-containing protein 4 [Culex quinquefasciatus]|uniref:SET and MYND domain-containing protein 4 n=1 Tax=Culex quinquefasciatus TaxID=7176 RepID=UPI0018E2AE97|nr:SET and MYND domain-containing protein 4 [Culex quinquefasciatus]
MELNATEISNGMWSCFLVDGELAQVEQKIKSYRSNDEVISFIRGVMDKHKLMKFIKLRGDPKSNARAIDCRKRGNEYFHPRIRQYIKAVELYNESIALAADNSEALAMAYANRSAICFELKEYADCLGNIRLARENPYPANLLPKLEQHNKLRYMNCNYCLDDNFLILKPCKGCTIAMFCSDECQQKAMEEYHRFECPILQDIHRLVEHVLVPALRLTIKTLTTFNFDLEALRLLMESDGKNTPNALDMDWTSIDLKETYEIVYNLESHRDKRSPNHLGQYAINAIIMSEILLQRTKIRDNCKNSNALRNITELLIMHHAMILPVNSFELSFEDYEDKACKREVLMEGIYPILSMINHSCAPNSQPMNGSDDNLALYVLRPIKKRSPITIKYCVKFASTPLQERREYLSENYCFQCQCEACANDYPLLENLKVVLQKDMKHESIRYCKRNKHDPKSPVDMLKMCLHMINKFDQHTPCVELEELETEVAKYFSDVYWNNPRKLKYKSLCNI